MVFTEILFCNLSKGTYSVIQSIAETPEGIPLDDFLLLRLDDIASGITRPWSLREGETDILSHLYSNSYDAGEIQNNRGVLPESREHVKEFFAAIHAGKPSGDVNIHICLENGKLRWYHFQYTCIFSENQPVSALICVEDITERHEYELAYLHWVHAVIRNRENLPLYMESCLTTDRIEKISGKLLNEEEKKKNYTHKEFVQMILRGKFRLEDTGDVIQHVDRDHLTRLYEMGEMQFEKEFRVLFADGTRHWFQIEITMVEDPFNGDIKIFTQFRDITSEKIEKLGLFQKAEYDAMTGLLRRDVGEARVREYLSAHRAPGGILLILDLDDLKGINDSLGHIYGDKALAAIGETLRKHFRKDDILMRFGGDEFVAFLPGAGDDVGAIKLSVETFLQKISQVLLGECNERAIHCSVGCAVELPDTDTFDSLYQRADMALYHVKRSGKNNYAFFVSEMLESKYWFRFSRN